MSSKMVFMAPPDRPLNAAVAAWLPRLAAAHPGVEFATPTPGEATRRELAMADAAFGTMTPDLLAAAPRLRWLQAPAAAPPAGYYFDELARHPVIVTNFRGIYNDHISYHVLGMMLSFTEHLHDYRDLQRDHRWQPLSGSRFNTIYPPECTVLIVGAGGIGIETARLAKALGMTVIATDARRTEPGEWLDELHPAESLDAVLPRADFVVVTVPHTPDTQGLFDRGRFQLMKPTAIFINIGRGMTTRLDDLDAALRTGEIAGAGLDVFEVEPLPADHPLWDAPNTLITPHVAVKEARHLDDRRFAIVEENLRRFVASEPLLNVVDKSYGF